jgi:propanediol utilization protein
MPQIIEQNHLTRIDILKVDIEGAEKTLLKNAEWLKIVQNILIEIHDDYDFEALKKDLTIYNFDLKRLGDRKLFWATKPIHTHEVV